ncbi:hypothetical protein AVEN_116746-1 [Araneus ventricosus]|uniref:Uncharacterized protein n=1 Tax=Araneus ventricosus TaxID=182803 RepID=A0A4Y2F2W5_ARAVE|nr:hypothetical protein AVEN_116746-1 [Araneus ventricosus]
MRIYHNQDPFTLQSFIKDKINRHTSIQNMKFTQQGKIILTTKDPVCAAQLLNLEKVVNIPVSTNVIWENITPRFLLYDIPTKVSLPEVAAELTKNNEIEIVEMRRFVKQNNTRETSPVLVTMLGTRLPGYMKIWFTNQRIQSFKKLTGHVSVQNVTVSQIAILVCSKLATNLS